MDTVIFNTESTMTQTERAEMKSIKTMMGSVISPWSGISELHNLDWMQTNEVQEKQLLQTIHITVNKQLFLYIKKPTA